MPVDGKSHVNMVEDVGHTSIVLSAGRPVPVPPPLKINAKKKKKTPPKLDKLEGMK